MDSRRMVAVIVKYRAIIKKKLNQYSFKDIQGIQGSSYAAKIKIYRTQYLFTNNVYVASQICACTRPPAMRFLSRISPLKILLLSLKYTL